MKRSSLFCGGCKIRMKCIKNGQYVVDGVTKSLNSQDALLGIPVETEVMVGDVYWCPECGSTTITGFGQPFEMDGVPSSEDAEVTWETQAIRREWDVAYG